ncbi:putative phosphoglycerate mutase [Sporomusaceae bacterium BoRhaA]|uniref:alpha-ribazole phosphatase n=1 Tax=Pelorhabdus rhamnosifermentans TaxID=2772457 RepID=UPI001C062BA4|nr:alpha-ribazole phosphatase [Pelorhabdus rhamnosifermentans]MBU2699678.1 putative phosphoglycerate mutase [Pelorhabdus rhamnosifermentans]
MENRTIYLIRHGSIQTADDQHRYIGQVDLPLNEVGVGQAQVLQQRFEHASIHSIYCSDLFRSQQTAEIIATHKKVVITARKDLREINLGEWENRTFAEIMQRFPQQFKARGKDIGYYCIPGGESFAQCSQRVVAAFHDIMNNSHGNILIVGHAGVNRLLLCHMLGIPIGNLFRISQDFGCLNIIHCNHTHYRLQLMNFK